VKIGVAGLGLIGGSIALGLRPGHSVKGYDSSAAAREAAAARGIDVVERLQDLLPADAVIVATPLSAVVPTLEALLTHARGASLIEVGSLKSAVAAFADRAPADARIVGLHPMAGSTSVGIAAADPAIFRGRPFLVVPTARTDDRSKELAAQVAQALGGSVTEVSVEAHDSAVSVVSALPLAVAMALARVAREAAPIELELVAGPGLHDATRLAATSPDLALALLAAPGLREYLASLRGAVEGIERALGDERALRALLERAAAARARGGSESRQATKSPRT
jgi:prephenate dehydrogenase